MPDWLDPVRVALDARRTPCTVFFRDDDAGWADARLLALLDCFAAHGVPIDLAVIPAALTPALADRLLARMCIDEAAGPGVHQHGYAHDNHEPAGRKCEFGPARDRDAQGRDLLSGRSILDAAFGALADPIFTPPWNRCTDDTAACLQALGFRALSRDVTAAPLATGELVEIPVAIDWCRLRPPGEPALALGEGIAAHVASAPRTGIMLHHAVLEMHDLGLLDELLPLLVAHPRAHCVRMRALLPPAGICAAPRAMPLRPTGARPEATS